MRDFGSWALNNTKLVYFVIAVLLIGGAKSFYDMSKLEDPEIKVKEALVVTVYPGASAHQVELEVTDVLEKSIRAMKDLDVVQSRSMNDVSMISISLSTLVKNNEVEQLWDMLRRKVADVQNKLPEGAGTSVVMDDFGDVYGMFYALTADGFSEMEINDYAHLIQREIQAIEGITRVNIYGEQTECIEIELFEDRMANLGVMPAEALSTLNGQNKTVYSGYYEIGDNRLRVSVSDRYRKVEDIENLLLQGHENDQLRLKDIARVRKTVETPVRNEMRYDRQHALGLAIAAQHGTDITKLGKQVEARLLELKNTRLPVGVEYHKVFFQPARVNDAIGDFMVNLAESLAIVIFILMLTMGFRSGVIIGTSLVIVVIGSFLVLNFFDGTLQRVSLAAFVLAMGMLVDNAIVIVDGILVDLKRGKPRREALTSIGRQTGMPLLAATLIAVLAFLPIFLSPDTAGVYVRDLFIVLAISLLLSWALALTLTPIQAGFMLRVKSDDNSVQPFDNKYYRALRKTLGWTLRNRILTIGGAVLLLAASVICYRFLPQGFFPDMNYDQLYIEYKLPEGTNSSKVKADLAEIEDYMFRRKEVTHVTSSIGGTPARYNLVRSIADPSLSYGELIVDFTSSAALVSNMQEIQTYLTDNYIDAYVRLKRYNLMYKKYPIELQFNGPDPAVLRNLTTQAMEIMKKSPDIFLVNTNWEPKTPTLQVEYSQPVARTIGLSRQDVGLSLLTATGGIPVSVFYDGSRSQTVLLKCVHNQSHKGETSPPEGKVGVGLQNSPVFSMIPSLGKIPLDGKTVQGLLTGAISEEDVLETMLGTIPLSQATHGIKIVWEDPVVIRYNGQRAMRAQGNPVFGKSIEDARQSIIGEIEKIELPEGYSVQWEGEHRASSSAMKYLFQNLPLGIILMIMLLLMLFKDYRKLFIIFCCIPLIMVGVIIAMLIMGKTFNFVAIVSTLGLMGMMIKNGIVLMDEIAMQISEGVEPVKALLDSASARFRPVMMASLTTIVGMLPLVADDLFGPGAVTIMGGLLFGTLITLLIMPVLYAVFFNIKNKKI
jgi:multidrug efflux pump subunit AcrB